MPAQPQTHCGVVGGSVAGLAEGSGVDVGSAVRDSDDDVSGIAQLIPSNQVEGACLPRTNYDLCGRGIYPK